MMKIQINSSLSSKNYFSILIFSMILLLIIASSTVFDFFKTKEYVKVDGIITDYGYTDNNYSDSDTNSFSRYAIVNYTYQEKEYTSKIRVFFGGKINKKISVYLDPNQPNKLKETFNTKIFLILDSVLLIFNIFCYKAYKQRKKEELSS